MFSKSKFILKIENGKEFKCKSKSYNSNFYGKIVFTTSNTGYVESVTDPSYFNYILVFSNLNIGSCGITKKDTESARIWASAIVVNKVVDGYSNHTASTSFRKFLVRNKVIIIETNEIRDIISEIKKTGSRFASIYRKKSKSKLNFNKLETNYVSTQIPYCCFFKRKKYYYESYKTLLIDFGVKKSTYSCLTSKGLFCLALNANSKKRNIEILKPSGLVLSSGPGDANMITNHIKGIKLLIRSIKIPILGICLGHQIISISLGINVEKMKYGHHGINHPIKFYCCKKLHISTQNHNYCVLGHDFINNSFYSLFDNSNQGFFLKKKLIITLQGHPEASPGTCDTKFIFGIFNRMIEKCSKIY
ncbi:carbamoyl phosphate synthase small subunit [Candidatus Vidania fulgoroideorum]